MHCHGRLSRDVRFTAIVAVVLALLVAHAPAQETALKHPVSGRVYAQPMSVDGAPWLDRTERDREEAPGQALSMLGVRKGSTVADVGAGSGYMTERLAALVGSTGRVYATDIQPGMIALIEQRLERRHISNVVPILGLLDDPKLPDNAIDLVLMVDVYHELSAPQAVLGHIKRALRPGGRLALLEYRGEDAWIPIRPEHKMTVSQAKLELEHEGFRLSRVNSTLPWQHLLVFTVAP
jgi:ubiquinone/menaquinone biosynthesis C-methylase UbiE